MKKKEDILQQIGGKSGFKVPDGYFEQLSSRITEQLPEREIPEPEVITTWQRLRPYIYMAAMFAGIWLMVQVFVAPHVQPEQALTADAQEATTEMDEELEDYLIYSMDEYTIFETLYADSE